MSDEASPRPWRLEDGFECEIVDATGRHVLTASSKYAIPPLGDEREAANAALIVDAVNHIEETKRLSIKLYDPIRRAEAERDRLRDELTRKTQNYEDVIAFHKRTEEYLRGLIKRLITVREKVFWRKDEKTGMTYETCLMDEDEARKTIEEAKAAIKEDKK